MCVLVTVLLLTRCVGEETSPAAIELGAPFADNAILQRQMPVPVWGWSKPGTKRTVEFAGRKKKATAGKDGKWMLVLEELQASFEPREMVTSDNHGKQVVIKNILVGEVWPASGQSKSAMSGAYTNRSFEHLRAVAKKSHAKGRQQGIDCRNWDKRGCAVFLPIRRSMCRFSRKCRTNCELVNAGRVIRRVATTETPGRKQRGKPRVSLGNPRQVRRLSTR